MPKKALAKIEEGDTAASVALGCAQLLDAGLAEQLGPAVEGEEGLGSGGKLAVRAARRLQGLKQHLELCQEGLARVRDELRPWRRKRDRAHEKLYDTIKNLRKICRSVYEDGDGDDFLGLHGGLPREPKELHAACGPLVARLVDARWPMPKKRWAGVKIKRDKLANNLIGHYGDLGKALAAIQEGETREAVAQAAKSRAEEAHSTFLAKSTRWLEVTLELGGLEDLAKSVRPGAGRRGRPAKKALTPAAPGLPGASTALPSAPDRARLPSGDPTGKAE